MKNQKTLFKIIYTNNVNYTEFRNNSMMVEACVFNLSQIGELVNKLDKEFMVSCAHGAKCKPERVIIP